MTEAPRSRVRLPACLLLASALLGCAVDVAGPTPVSPSSPEAPPASAPKAATPRTNEGSGKPQGSDAPIGPAMGEVIHGSFGEAIDVDLLPPAPVDTPLGRNRRRVDLDQLDACFARHALGVFVEACRDPVRHLVAHGDYEQLHPKNGDSATD